MKVRHFITLLLSMIIDLIGAFFLCTYALIIGPLGILRGPIVLERIFLYMWVFLPMGALAQAIRVGLDWRLGHFAIAISQAENLIDAVEAYLQKKPTSRARIRVLTDLYTLLTRAYMHAGHVDESMQVILRAHKILKINKLNGLPELDAKTAHLVRAGLAAGRLLEGGGLATMFVKTSPRAEAAHTQENTKPEKTTSSSPAPQKGAKIIPFPQKL